MLAKASVSTLEIPSASQTRRRWGGRRRRRRRRRGVGIGEGSGGGCGVCRRGHRQGRGRRRGKRRRIWVADQTVQRELADAPHIGGVKLELTARRRAQDLVPAACANRPGLARARINRDADVVADARERPLLRRLRRTERRSVGSRRDGVVLGQDCERQLDRDVRASTCDGEEVRRVVRIFVKVEHVWQVVVGVGVIDVERLAVRGDGVRAVDVQRARLHQYWYLYANGPSRRRPSSSRACSSSPRAETAALGLRSPDDCCPESVS